MDINTAKKSFCFECSVLRQFSLDKFAKRKPEEEPEPPDPELYPWGSCESFTVESGQEQIEAFIQSWGFPPIWYHTMDFLYAVELDHCTMYYYRARFSTPTNDVPILGTAGVFFAMEVSKIDPPTSPVEVCFLLESNRLVHVPGKNQFREKWLDDLIESKKLLQSAVNL